MYIKRVQIKNFRSIKDADIILHNITAIVGENNAGKTAILKALNSVFNFDQEKSFFISKAHQYISRANSKITITLDNIPDKSFYSNYIYNSLLCIEMTFLYSSNKRKLFCLRGSNKITLEDSFFAELSKDIEYVYIPTNRGDRDYNWSTESIFKNLLINSLSQYTQKRDLLSSEVKKAADKMHKGILSRIEKDLNKLYMQNKSVNFHLGFDDSLDYKYLLDKLSLSIDEDNIKLPISEYGSGVNSLAIIALYRANALLKDSDTILGIEEPETNLHPQAQKRFISSLKEKMHQSEIQTLFSTHSPVIIDELGHEDIVLVQRKSDARGFSSNTTQLPDDFWSKYNLEEFKHYQFFNYKNSDFFFSKYVILTESKNDSQVINFFISPSVKEKIFDISILNVDGKENLKYPYFLLKELNIPFSLVVDKDFFVNYKNNNVLKNSRNSRTGLPEYNKAIIENNPIINDLYKTQNKKNLLQQKINGNYRDFFNFIKPDHIFPMHYSLEIDLTGSIKACEEFYTLLNIPLRDRTKQHLLLFNSTTIKDVAKIITILKKIDHKNYPESYQKIRSAIVSEINNIY